MAGKSKIEAFDTWCWRRALRISWTKKVRNDEVFWRLNTREINMEYAKNEKNFVDWARNKKESLDNNGRRN